MATKIEVTLHVTVKSDSDDVDEILENLTEYIEDLDDDTDRVEDVEIADWKKSDS